MILYLSIIIIAMILTVILNYFLGNNGSFLMISLWVVIATVSEIVIDSIFATVGRWLIPKKLVSIDKKWLSATKKESKFYEKIGIKRWKDKTLDLGAVTGFSKKKLGDATDNNYVERFIVEANHGVIVHALCIIFGFLVICIMDSRMEIPSSYSLSFSSSVIEL